VVLQSDCVLSDIKDDAQQVSDAIAAVMNLDIIIYDHRLEIVAATGGAARSSFWSECGTNVCGTTLRAKKPLVIGNSGENELCRGCRIRDRCPQTAEITYPIALDGKAIGVISLTAFDGEQRAALLGRSKQLLAFLEKMTGLLVSKLLMNGLYRRTSYLAEQLSTFVNAVREGIVAVNEEGVVVEFNAPAEQILGLTRESAIGRPLSEILPRSPLLESVKTGRPFAEQEVRQRVAGRGHVPVMCAAEPIMQEGRVVGAIATFRDISEVRRLIHDLTDRHRSYSLNDIIGQSSALRQVKEKARRAAASDSTILMTGETGTGKELFARAIHAISRRSAGPFKAVNCAAIPEGLLESELFGYEGGAFTGARRSGKPGKFELASGGTLFLDEVGDMPLHLQAKLLRVLEERCVERIGGTTPIDVDVRVIAATNHNLEEMMAAGEFRKDLFYRLNVVPIHIPPLRERTGDIDLLCEFFVDKYARLMRKAIRGLSPEACQVLYRYSWPGNVRELENAIEYAVNMEGGPVISVANLPPRLLAGCAESAPVRTAVPRLEEAERMLIRQALTRCGNDYEGKSRAARMLGIHVATLYRKIKKYGIEL